MKYEMQLCLSLHCEHTKECMTIHIQIWISPHMTSSGSTDNISVQLLEIKPGVNNKGGGRSEETLSCCLLVSDEY